MKLKITAKDLQKKLGLKDGSEGKQGIQGLSGSPDTGAEIVSKINRLPLQADLMIDASHIKNLLIPMVGKSSSTNSTPGDSGITIASVSSLSTDATKSLYTMSSGVPVEFRRSGGGNLLYIDETNGRIAINYNAPAGTFEIWNPAQTGYIQYSFPSPAPEIYSPHAMYFKVGNGERYYYGSPSQVFASYSTADFGMTIGRSYNGATPPADGLLIEGKLAIGSNSAATPLDVTGTTTLRGDLFFGTDNTYDIGGGSSNPRSGYFKTYLTAPYLYGGDKTGTVYSGYSGAILGGFSTHAVLDFWDNNVRIGEFYTTSSAFNFFTDTGKDLNFYTNNDLSTPVISALSGGNVGIGTGAPSYLFHVLKTQNASTSITIENQSSGASAAARLDLARSFGADLYGTLYYAGDGNTVKTSNSLNIETANGSDGGIFITTINSSAPIVFSTANTTRWKIGSNGHFIAPTDNTYDIGASGATRPRTGYFGTKVIAPLIESTSTVRLKGFTVATLPAGTVGDTAYVTDALAPTYLTAIVGGGAIVTPVFYDGTNWVAH